ncbi:hypothetical protein EVB94_259 [Rhizobium phage RHph_TM40]|uniref:Uncharacterized protein n=2 Tax=Cuauhnahuacvirus TaxID=3044696 RepID=A0A7S5UYY2_9CAUD|nr:hypothetical protein PQC16_gp259 [Rhizobium phage RHph_TM30]YP_010671409.1 hypothetical protein PQC17_gp260 [Rhizobium phage RHph_Y65]QIG71730.1 hypothetical protein EVB94_259 [Rhizobium phage RHph_TM40]QIG72093.1 hypothetical protein EVB95_259 [Rhizobium phage RHph_TM2_3B]QIG71366.1 hypothetical protein EVB93_259 [Rhizobium phage RHph_TM30]QIG72818.1 hypothetical protein EVB97_260 [Rhizobium phage RHph_Y65]
MKDLREFKSKLDAKFDTQTSWGKNQIKQVINDTYIEIIESKVEGTIEQSTPSNRIDEDSK